MKHYRLEEVGDVTLGGGHSESDAFLIVHDRVALMADLLGIRMHPWMGDGHPERWIEILEEIEQRYPDWDFQGEMVDRNRTFLRERAT